MCGIILENKVYEYIHVKGLFIRKDFLENYTDFFYFILYKMDILNKGRSLMSEKMHDKMIQHSVFASIVFLIVAHPKTFQLVDSVIKVHNKNILLLVHALVVGLLMYFGSLYVFEPVQKVLLEGFNGKKK